MADVDGNTRFDDEGLALARAFVLSGARDKAALI